MKTDIFIIILFYRENSTIFQSVERKENVKNILKYEKSKRFIIRLMDTIVQIMKNSFKTLLLQYMTCKRELFEPCRSKIICFIKIKVVMMILNIYLKFTLSFELYHLILITLYLKKKYLSVRDCLGRGLTLGGWCRA